MGNSIGVVPSRGLDEFDPGTFMNEYLSDLFLTAIFASLNGPVIIYLNGMLTDDALYGVITLYLNPSCLISVVTCVPSLRVEVAVSGDTN